MHLFLMLYGLVHFQHYGLDVIYHIFLLATGAHLLIWRAKSAERVTAMVCGRRERGYRGREDNPWGVYNHVIIINTRSIIERW